MPSVQFCLQRGQLLVPLADFLLPLLTLRLPLLLTRGQFASLQLDFLPAGGNLRALFLSSLLPGVQLDLQCSQLRVPLADFLLPPLTLRLPLLPTRGQFAGLRLKLRLPGVQLSRLLLPGSFLPGVQLDLQRSQLRIPLAAFLLPLLTLGLPLLLARRQIAGLRLHLLAAGGNLRLFFHSHLFPGVQLGLQCGQLRVPLADFLLPLLTLGLPLLLTRGQFASLRLKLRLPGVPLPRPLRPLQGRRRRLRFPFTPLFFDRPLPSVQFRLQCGQLLVPLVDFFFPLPPLGIPLLPLHKRIGAPGHGEVALVGRAELDDFQLDAANTEAVAGAERGVGERLAIQSRVERPAANNGGLFAAENEAMDRSHPRSAEPQGATRSGADAALARADADELAVAVRPADAENQLADGGVQ